MGVRCRSVSYASRRRHRSIGVRRREEGRDLPGSAVPVGAEVWKNDLPLGRLLLRAFAPSADCKGAGQGTAFAINTHRDKRAGRSRRIVPILAVTMRGFAVEPLRPAAVFWPHRVIPEITKRLKFESEKTIISSKFLKCLLYKYLNIGIYKFFEFALDHFTRKHICLSFGPSGIFPVRRFEFSVRSVVSIDPLTFFFYGFVI